MKCNNCGGEVVVREGTTSGFCHQCGVAFTVKKGTQTLDGYAMRKLASAVVDEQESRAKKLQDEKVEKDTGEKGTKGGEGGEGQSKWDI